MSPPMSMDVTQRLYQHCSHILNSRLKIDMYNILTSRIYRVLAGGQLVTSKRHGGIVVSPVVEAGCHPSWRGPPRPFRTPITRSQMSGQGPRAFAQRPIRVVGGRQHTKALGLVSCEWLLTYGSTKNATCCLLCCGEICVGGSNCAHASSKEALLDAGLGVDAASRVPFDGHCAVSE